jgi:hypothetical protein
MSQTTIQTENCSPSTSRTSDQHPGQGNLLEAGKVGINTLVLTSSREIASARISDFESVLKVFIIRTLVVILLP